MGTKELEFVAPFRVEAAGDGQCDALLAWFDTHFLTKCDAPVSFSTGPVTDEGAQTHWKQTAFYLDGGVALQAGDAVEGVLHCHRAKGNPRHLDIVIEWAVVRAGGARGSTEHQAFELH